MKAFPNLSREYIRSGISYENLIMLLSVIPPYRGNEEGEAKSNSKKGKSNGKKSSIGEDIKHWEQFNF